MLRLKYGIILMITFLFIIYKCYFQNIYRFSILKKNFNFCFYMIKYYIIGNIKNLISLFCSGIV